MLSRIVKPSVVAMMFLASITAVPQENKGRIDIHVRSANASEGIADVTLSLQGPYAIITSEALDRLYKPNPALTLEMRVRIDRLIASSPAVTAEELANAAMRMEAELLGLPVPNLVSTNPSPPPARLFGATDGNGNFSFNNLDTGRYVLIANRDGWFAPSPTGCSASFFARETLLSIIAKGGEPVQIDIKLLHGATISGRVWDPNGQAMSGVDVRAYCIEYRRTGLVLSEVISNRPTTDDRGQYRLFGLPPGDYFIGVTPLRNTTAPLQAAYARTFFPGTSNSINASLITATEDDDVSAIDIGVRSDATGRISGRAVGPALVPNGQPPIGDRLFLVPRDARARIDNLSVSFQNSSPDRASGRFEIRGVLPGSYDLIATMADDGPFLGRTRVDVAGTDLNDVIVPVTAGRSVKARLSADNGPVPFTMAVPASGGARGSNADIPAARAAPTTPVPTPTYRLALRSMELLPDFFERSVGSTTFDPSGTFVFSNVPDGRFNFSVNGIPPSYYIADIRAGDMSIFDDGFVPDTYSGDIEVKVNSNGARVTGLVHDTEQKPYASARVILVPPPSRRQNILLYKSAMTDAQGTFDIEGIAPGEYKLFAWKAIPGMAYLNEDFMKKYESSGQSITVTQGAIVTKDLVVIPQ